MSATERTLEVLALVGESHDGLSLSKVSETLGYPLPTTHRLLKTLVDTGFVRRDETTLEYFAGRRLLRLASVVRRGTLASTADQVVRELSERFNETVMLTQLMDGRAVCVGLAESRRPLHLSVSVGRAVPLHAAASARVLYSGETDDEVRNILKDHEFERLLPGTPRNVDDVLRHLGNIREHGYDVCDNEFDQDVWAASAPVHGPGGAVVAGLTLTIPQERGRDSDLRQKIIAAVLDAAADISTAIGGQVPGRSAP